MHFDAPVIIKKVPGQKIHAYKPQIRRLFSFGRLLNNINNLIPNILINSDNPIFFRHICLPAEKHHTSTTSVEFFNHGTQRLRNLKMMRIQYNKRSGNVFFSLEHSISHTFCIFLNNIFQVKAKRASITKTLIHITTRTLDNDYLFYTYISKCLNSSLEYALAKYLKQRLMLSLRQRPEP